MGRKKRSAAAISHGQQPQQQQHYGNQHYPPPHQHQYQQYGHNPNPYVQPPPINMMGMPPNPLPHPHYPPGQGHGPPPHFQPPLPPSSTVPPPAATNNSDSSNPAKKKQKVESFSVKKYRVQSNKTYRTIDAFQRYTKSHRMSDATFAQIYPPNRGATPQCPIVFSIQIGGSDLSWGRGRTRDIAIDNACRAAFALVAAHGYTDFDCNEDCLTVEPTELLVESGNGNGSGGKDLPLPPVPMGVPPPLPPGGPPMPPGLPPGLPPNGSVPPPMMGGMGHMGVPPPMMNLPPPPIPLPPKVNEGVTLIPQAKSLSSEVAVAGSISRNTDGSSTNTANGISAEVNASGGDGKGKTSLSLFLDKKAKDKERFGSNGMGFSKKIKGGLTLLYDSEAKEDGDTSTTANDNREILSLTMEMRRAKLDKYKNVLLDSFKMRLTGTGL